MPRITGFALVLVVLVVNPTGVLAQPAAEAPPALEAIQQSDLERDLFEFASDEMLGREAGTINEFRSAAWLAIKAAEAGLEPAGDDGTYFQYFELYRHGLSRESAVYLGDERVEIGEGVVAAIAASAEVEAPVLEMKDADDVRGAAVVIRTDAPEDLTGLRPDMDALRHFTNEVMQTIPLAIMSGAAAIIAVPDSITAGWFPEIAHILGRDSYSLQPSGPSMQSPIPIVVMHPDHLDGLEEETVLRLNLETVTSTYPSVNVVARAPGTDLSDEYVLYSAHHDHDGYSDVGGERRVWNGADDNGSGSMALLAAGRAFVQQPARRSALFVWHGAEEKGLIGARRFSENPTVERDAIVAVLNADMVGRNHADSTFILGITPGNRNSTDLAEAALTANDLSSQFVIDRSLDQPGHPERFWQRSDHFPYVMAGFPALFFTSGLHPDYHTPADTPELINYEKLTKMARWIYATGWIVANRDAPPALD